MAGLIFVSPGSFTDAGDLPQVSPNPVTPIRGAAIDWAAERLSPGRLSSWTDMLGAKTLAAPDTGANQEPTVTGGGASRRVVFDGTNDRMLADMDMGQALTMVVVARATAVGEGTQAILSGHTSQTWNLITTSANPGSWAFSTQPGESFILGPTADTSWHLFLIVADGANSVFSVDGAETEGTLNGAHAWQQLSVAAAVPGGYFGVELKRLAVIPRAINAAERGTLTQQLTAHYGI